MHIGDLARRMVALTAALALAVPAAPGWAQDEEALEASGMAACATAAEPADCLLPILLRSGAAKARLALAGVIRTDPAQGNVPTAIAGAAAALAADRAGAQPAVALAGVASLPPLEAVEAMTTICTEHFGAVTADFGPAARAWALARRPSNPLMSLAAERLDAIAAAPGIDPALAGGALGGVYACRVGLGDFTAGDQALDRAMGAMKLPDQAAKLLRDPRTRMMFLMPFERWDDALALLRTARPADMMSGGPIIQWSGLQDQRTRVMTSAIAVGRPDVADRAAELVLETALAPERPKKSVMHTGVSRALGWLSTRPDKARLLVWLERYDTFVRPDQRGWNGDDAVAVHRGWIAAGRPDRARAYLAVIEKEAARPKAAGEVADADKEMSLEPAAIEKEVNTEDPAWIRPNDSTLVVMRDGQGQWGSDGQLIWGLFADLTAHVAEQSLPVRLGRATAETRFSLLEYCVAAPAEGSLFEPTEFDPLALPVAAGCARQLAPLWSPPKPDDAGAANAANPFMQLAARAAVSDDRALAGEMLRLALRTTGPSLEPVDVDFLTTCVIMDLHARGKL